MYDCMSFCCSSNCQMIASPPGTLMWLLGNEASHLRTPLQLKPCGMSTPAYLDVHVEMIDHRVEELEGDSHSVHQDDGVVRFLNAIQQPQGATKSNIAIRGSPSINIYTTTHTPQHKHAWELRAILIWNMKCPQKKLVYQTIVQTQRDDGTYYIGEVPLMNLTPQRCTYNSYNSHLIEAAMKGRCGTAPTLLLWWILRMVKLGNTTKEVEFLSCHKRANSHSGREKPNGEDNSWIGH